MSVLDAILLGIVEGITEFLPISSTGHLILASYLFDIPQTTFLKTFEVVIQLGAIGAIVTLYWQKIFFDRALMQRVFVALLPAMVIGLLFYQAIKSLFESHLTVVSALFVGGVLLIVFEWWYQKRERVVGELAEMTYRQAFGVGLFQALSVIPGVSRAGATILGGLMLGLKREAIVEFSFLLAVPTMLAATVLDITKHGFAFKGDDLQALFVGFITAFFVALLAVKFLLRFIQTHTFIGFGIYRIVVALVFFLFIL